MDIRVIPILVIGVVIGVAGGWYFSAPQPTSPPVPITTKTTIDLPEEFYGVRFGDCSDRGGVHFTRTEDMGDEKLIAGPTYVTWVPTGVVTALEYHVSEEATLLREEALEAKGDTRGYIGHAELPSFGVSVNHVTVDFSPGHGGFNKPHYDVNLWLISPEERDQLDCVTVTIPHLPGEQHAQPTGGPELIY